MNFIMNIINWFINLFTSTAKVSSPSVWEQMAIKNPPLNPVLWKHMIHRFKSRIGQLKQLALPLNERKFKHFGTFSACKPFRCNHKSF